MPGAAAPAQPAPADPSMGAVPAADPAAMGAAPAADPNMQADPAAMGGDPAAMGGAPAADPAAMDPGMASDPAAMDPSMTEEPVDGASEGTDDSTIAIINGLSPEDREAVRKYALSISNNSEEDAPAEEPAPMQESVVFSKKQLSEVFGILDKKDAVPTKKTKKSSNSPFTSPIRK